MSTRRELTAEEIYAIWHSDDPYCVRSLRHCAARPDDTQCCQYQPPIAPPPDWHPTRSREIL